MASSLACVAPSGVGSRCVATQRGRCSVVVRATPELKKPARPVPPAEAPKRLFEESQQPAAPAPAPAAPQAEAVATTSGSSGVTIEWQRSRAKEMRKYFVDQQLEAQVKKAQLFGWTPANEIGNGRWVMFGVFVGLLTEYATGVDFPDQIALLLSYLGITDADVL